MITAVSEKTGLRLLEIFRQHGDSPFILMLSEHPNFSPAQRSVRLGVANFLMKLSNTNRLLQAMEETLKEEVISDALWDGRVFSPETIDESRSSSHGHIDLTGAPEPIKKAVQYVEENLPSRITLRDVADEVHLNASYLSVLFKKVSVRSGKRP